MKYHNNISLIIFLFFFSSFDAQELPPIKKYTTDDYGGGNQNWMISQAPNKFIYVANNEGLLEYNGANWKMYPSPNNTIIRSVMLVDNRIYSGCYMEFGYWQKDNYGELKYLSLVPYLKVKMIADEHFWNIVKYKKWILFQSFNRIYFYNTINNKYTIINSNHQITKVFNINSNIYYYVLNEGLYKIEEGKSKLISNNPVFDKGIIINIFPIDSGLLIQTRNSGFYTLINKNVNKWSIQANKILNEI
ncbi:MAG: hypothetical protein Q8S44_00450, partial [Flavobacteriaceae bacterium]|nr:hypothetical protein [Flavobacteriaceae bacterium]